jgi:hypothetical protein
MLAPEFWQAFGASLAGVALYCAIILAKNKLSRLHPGRKRDLKKWPPLTPEDVETYRRGSHVPPPDKLVFLDLDGDRGPSRDFASWATDEDA